MRGWRWAVAAGAACGAALGASWLAAEDPSGRQRAVYHINGADPHVYKGALGNVRNHLNTVGDGNADIRVVLNGDGVLMLRDAQKDPELLASIEALRKRQVGFEICAITLESRHLSVGTDLADIGATSVPSGVVELTRLQQRGYAYIKP
jgi:uncharacterized protein